MRFQQIPNRRPVESRSFARKFWGLSKLILVVGLAVMAGWLFIKHKVNHDLCRHVQAKISEGLKNTGMIAGLGQARFHEGQGIQLNDLIIGLAHSGDGSNPSSKPSSSLRIYEAFIHVPVSLPELATQELDIRSVEFRRAKLTLVRDQNGEWDIQKIVETLKSLPAVDNGPIPLALRDCEIQIIDQTSSRLSPINLTGLNVFIQPIVHENRALLQISGGFRSDAISKVDFATYLDRSSQAWQARFTATQARLSRELTSLLPSTIQSELQNLNSFTGILNFDATVTGVTNNLPDFSIAGDIAQFSIDDDKLPVPLQNVSADFVINNNGFAINNASGRMGEGTFHQSNYSQDGLLERQQWHWDGVVNQFQFENSQRMNRWLPAYCKKFCDEYSPSGKSDFSFSLTQTGTEMKREITSHLTDMSFSFYKMPYRVDHCSGQVKFKDDFCEFNVRSLPGNETCEFKGFVKGIGAKPTYEVNVSVPGDVPIDQKLLHAIDQSPKMAEVIRDFQPTTGRVGGIGKIEKRTYDGPVIKRFDIRLKQCSIRHKTFDYPIYNVSGLIQTEDDEYTFTDLTGNNASGKVICNGRWDPANGLFARFLCESIPLNDQLRYALKPDLQETWNGFRPRGTLDFMRVDMTLPIGQPEVDLVIEARMEKHDDQAQANYISIHPVWFPYEINHVTGQVNIGNETIKLTNFKGNHQKTWIACGGDGRYSNDAWSVKLKDVIVGALKVDDDLLSAVPTSLANPVRQLKFDGLLSVNGEFTIGSKVDQMRNNRLATYRPAQNRNGFSASNPTQIQAASTVPPQQSTTLAWDLRLDMNQANMLIGFPIENVFGNVKLVGQYDGLNATCNGDLDIESLTVYGVQVTNIRGPIWMDNDRTAAGVFARPNSTDHQLNNVNPLAEGRIKPESLTGQMHQGTVHFDAEMNSGPTGEFRLQANLEDGCLKTACREFATEMSNIEGHSFATIQMSGDYTGTHSHRGNGTIQLKKAKIHELPVFLSMLKLRTILQADRTAFDSSNIEFEIKGENIEFHRMEFIGDAISLLGNGKMNLDQDIDLNFYSVMGRNRFHIPLLSDLYKAGSQKILWININGKLDNPQTHRHVLPGISDSLQQLFQPRQGISGPRFPTSLPDSYLRTPSDGSQVESHAAFGSTDSPGFSTRLFR